MTHKLNRKTGEFFATRRRRSRAAATSKMEYFVIIVNGFQPLTIITKHSILDVAAALDPPLIHHNRVRDVETQLLTEICNDVEIEPPLQPFEREIINGLTGVNAKPHVRGRGFWREGQNIFFDVRITNCESQCHLTSKKIFTKHEREKKRQYNNKIMNIEHCPFTPLVFSMNGGMAKECLKFHKFVAEKIAKKSGCRYEKVLSIIKCKLSFLILCASLMCVRGSRSLTTQSGNHAVDDFEIAFDYTLGWDLLIWDLKGRVCFGSLIKIFVPVHRSTLSSSCICSILNHTAPTADILLVIHFYISLCEVLLIHTPFYLITTPTFFIFIFIHQFTLLIMIVIVSITYLNRFILDVYIS